MKKEIEMKRKEQDELETQKIMNAIHEQHKKAIQVVEKKEKGDKRDTIIVTILVIMTIVLIGAISVMFLFKDNEDFMKKCTEAGYSESYCRSQL